MDKEGLVHFLDKMKKSKRTIASYVEPVRLFEKCLSEQKQGKRLGKADIKDLHNFERRGGIQMNRALW